jgi:hypothetical protein
VACGADAKGEQEAADVEPGDRGVGVPRPSVANNPAPASDPTVRAESDVVREAPIALTKRSAGMVSATRALRIARSDGRTSPAIAAMTNTCSGRNVAV